MENFRGLKPNLKFLIFISFFPPLINSIDHDLWELFDQDTSYLAIHNQKMSKTKASDFNVLGYPIMHWDYSQQTWVPESNFFQSAISIALGNGVKWIINNDQAVWLYDEATQIWSPEFEAFDLKVGSNNQTLYVSKDLVVGGGYIIRSTDALFAKIGIGVIGALKVGVSADINGKVWLIDSSNQVLSYEGSIFEDWGEMATDVIVGNDNIPFIVTNTATGGGFTIKRFNPSTGDWKTLPGIGGQSIALDSNNQPYIVTTAGDVYRQRNLTYDFCPSKSFSLYMIPN